ncbi:NADP-dependent oxidoreductase [Streptomyces sp. NPDC048111]|uniref:NADP-dependent oxidoreductase n=1 Tax=Streptomyces sp. NPDC048111 TaxID=3365500 RepID=UPI00371D9E69
MSQTMRAISAPRLGGPDVLAEIDVERPEPGPTEVLVRVHAAGVNPADWKIREHGGFGRETTPPVLGFDVSGTVEAVGLGVTLYAVGDEVFGMPLFPHQAGAYAEYVAAPARHFVRKPAGIDHIQAAALPLASLTAWQALVDTGRLQAGQRVLIHAAAGGVGHLAVQIAKARGAYVIGTASAAKHDFVKGLGADEVIDYHAVDFTEAVSDVDVVLDAVGGDYSARSLTVLRPGGTLVSINTNDEPGLLAEAAARGVRAGFTLVEPDHLALRALADLVEEGRLRAEIDSVFDLSDAAKAHEHGERGRTRGKIVLRVAE